MHVLAAPGDVALGSAVEPARIDAGHAHADRLGSEPADDQRPALREIVRRQPLPGYRLTIEPCANGPDILTFAPTDPIPFGTPRRRRRANRQPGDKL